MNIITSELQDQMDSMIGNLWLYNGREVRIKGFNINNDQVRVINSGRPIVLPADRLEEKLDEFLPVQDEPYGGTKTAAMQVFENDSNQISSLEEIIMDNIRKVQTSKDYLPQATAVTNNVNTLLNMSKQKIAMLKELRRHRGNGS